MQKAWYITLYECRNPAGKKKTDEREDLWVYDCINIFLAFKLQIKNYFDIKNHNGILIFINDACSHIF